MGLTIIKFFFFKSKQTPKQIIKYIISRYLLLIKTLASSAMDLIFFWVNDFYRLGIMEDPEQSLAGLPTPTIPV